MSHRINYMMRPTHLIMFSRIRMNQISQALNVFLKQYGKIMNLNFFMEVKLAIMSLIWKDIF